MGSNPIELSFVIPAHNEERFLGKCLDAIRAELARTPVSAEIIVVNNASTDGTKAVAKRYREVIVVDEPKKGLPHARQAGFLRAKGALIANIDADTLLPRGWTKKVLKEFKRDPRLVALSGPYIYHDLPRATRMIVRMFYGLALLAYFFNRHILNAGSMLQGGNYVARRTALEAIGGYDTSITFYGEDTDTARRLHKVGGVKFTPRLSAYSSGRRLAREGLLTVGLRYAINYFWVMCFKKPFTKTSIDVRGENN